MIVAAIESGWRGVAGPAVALFFVVVAGLAGSGESRSSKHIELSAGMARVLCEAGDYEKGLALYSRLLEQTDGSAYVRIYLAGALLDKGEYELAEKHYRLALSNDPDSPIAMYNLGYALLKVGRVGEGEEILRRFRSLYGNTLSGLAREAGKLPAKFEAKEEE